MVSAGEGEDGSSELLQLQGGGREDNAAGEGGVGAMESDAGDVGTSQGRDGRASIF